MIYDVLKTALRNIARNRMRTLLTMLGIVIGVASVVIMVGVGKGAENQINQSINALGTNVLMVRAGSSSQGGVRGGWDSKASLKFTDIEQIAKQGQEIVAVSGVIRSNGQLVAQGNNWPSEVNGVNPSYQKIRNWKLASGRFFNEQENKSARKVAVIGQTTATELFGTQDPIGLQFRVGTVPFTVIGVLAILGQNAMGQDQDDIVIAPINTVATRLNGENHLRQIIASAQSMASMDSASAELSRILRSAHRLRPGEDDDFSVRTQSEILETASSMSKTLTMLLSAIAGVSLLVGGIGIMNIMLVSVTERTREIGIRMALGARGFDILVQFLVESVVLCLVGGLVGILISVVTCTLIAQFSSIPAVLDAATMMGAAAFSGLVGVFFGFYPARKAAQLNPIEALRYE